MRDARQERTRRAGERKVLAWVAATLPGSTVKDLCTLTNLSERTVRQILRDLGAKGKVDRRKTRRFGVIVGGVGASPSVTEYRYVLRTARAEA